MKMLSCMLSDTSSDYQLPIFGEVHYLDEALKKKRRSLSFTVQFSFTDILRPESISVEEFRDRWTSLEQKCVLEVRGENHFGSES